MNFQVKRYIFLALTVGPGFWVYVFFRNNRIRIMMVNYCREFVKFLAMLPGGKMRQMPECAFTASRMREGHAWEA